MSGLTPTFSIGAVTALAAGAVPTVSVTGSAAAPVLNIGIPGGIPGSNGLTPTFSVGAVTALAAGAAPTVSVSGTAAAPVLNVGIPAGAAGLSGVTPSFSIGSVTALAAGATPTVSVTGTASSPVLNVGIPAGASGSNGVTPAFSVGSVTSLAAGATPTVSVTGTSANPVLNVGLPAGAAGSNGQTPAFTVGSVAALAAGATPTVSITGTAASPVLNVGIPSGAPGNPGDVGPAPVFGTPIATSLAAGATPTVGATGSGTSASPLVLALGVPQGSTGGVGPTGPAPVFGTPSASSLAAGSTPTISTSGSGTAASPLTLAVGVPAGQQGIQGVQGPIGPAGPPGSGGGTATPGYVTIPAATSAYISAPSATANDMGSDDTYAINMTLNMPALPTGTQWIASKYAASNAGSGNSEFQVYVTSSGGIDFGYYDAGDASYYGSGSLGTLPTGATGTLNILVNASAVSVTGYGQTLATKIVEAVWTPTGGSATVLGSAALHGNTGLTKLGASSAPLVFGGYYAGASTPITLYAASLTNIASTPTIYANPAIAGATGGVIANDSAGNVWTVGSGATLVNATSGGSGGSASIATAAAAGLVLPDTVNNTTAVDALGHLSATQQIAVQAAMAPVARSLQLRAGDVINVADFCEASKPCGSGQAVGADYGATLAAMEVNHPFLADGQYSGGVEFTQAAVGSGDIPAITLSGAGTSGSTAYTIQSAENVAVGDSIYDSTANKSIGVVAAITGTSITLVSPLTFTPTNGDQVLVARQTNATAATPTSSAVLAITASNEAVAVAGEVVTDSTQSNAVVGTVSSISGANVTLTANSAIAVATGDQLFFSNMTDLPFVTDFYLNGSGFGTTEHVAKWQDPGIQSFYIKAGYQVTDVTNSTSCLPAGETIASLDSVQADANYGHITLTLPEVYPCPYGTSYHFRPTDAQAQAITVDSIAFGDAAYRATNGYGTGGKMRAVRLPDGPLYINIPAIHHVVDSNAGDFLVIEGYGKTSIVYATTDFGVGKAAMSSNSNGQGHDATIYRDFTIAGPGNNPNSGNLNTGAGVKPSQDVGLVVGTSATADNVLAQGFYAGFEIDNDHGAIVNSGATANYCGILFGPLMQSAGNQIFIRNTVTNNFESGMCLAYSAGFDSGTVIELHDGFSPYAWEKLAQSPIELYSSVNGFVTNSTLIDNWQEATAEGYAHCDTFSGDHCQWSFNTEIQAWGAGGDLNYGYYLTSTHAMAQMFVSSFTNNNFLGYSAFSDIIYVGGASIVAINGCSGNHFIGQDTMLEGPGPTLGRTLPIMACGSIGAGNTFTGGDWTGVFVAPNVSIARGASLGLTSLGLLTPYTGGSMGFLGAAGEACASTVSITDLVTSTVLSGLQVGCPAVRNGTQVPVLMDPSNSSLSVTSGSAITPQGSNGSFTSNTGLSTEVGLIMPALNTYSAGSGQVGLADLTR